MSENDIEKNTLETGAANNNENFEEGKGAMETEGEPAVEEPKSIDQLEKYFNQLRTIGKKNAEEAAELVLAKAEEMAGKQADRAMHLLDGSMETVNGALERIGTELVANKDGEKAFEQIQIAMDRLRGEAREQFAGLKIESANNNDGFAGQEEQSKAA